MRSVPAREVNRWDNQPPERLPDEVLVLAPEESEEVLRATADMRLAVVSDNYSLAAELWNLALPVLAKVNAFAQEQAKAFVDDVRKHLASAARLALLAALAWAFGVLGQGEAITAVLKALHLH